MFGLISKKKYNNICNIKDAVIDAGASRITWLENDIAQLKKDLDATRDTVYLKQCAIDDLKKANAECSADYAKLRDAHVDLAGTLGRADATIAKLVEIANKKRK